MRDITILHSLQFNSASCINYAILTQYVRVTVWGKQTICLNCIAQKSRIVAYDLRNVNVSIVYKLHVATKIAAEL